MSKNKKSLLDDKKLKLLFPAILSNGCFKKYIAYSLNVSIATVDRWLNCGEAVQEKFEEKLEPLSNVCPFTYSEVFENRKDEFINEFKELYGVNPEENIPDRLYSKYTNYIDLERKKFIEFSIQRKENDILEDINFDEDEDTDREYKNYLKFYRIYQRGRNVTEIQYLNNVERHAATSKNVGLSLKMLQMMNKEDFSEQPIFHTTNNIGLVDTQSILDLAIQYEKNKKLSLEKKESQIIDVKPIETVNLLEKPQDESGSV